MSCCVLPFTFYNHSTDTTLFNAMVPKFPAVPTVPTIATVPTVPTVATIPTISTVTIIPIVATVPIVGDVDGVAACNELYTSY